MNNSLIVINRRHAMHLTWYNITIPPSEIKRVKDRVIISMLLPDTAYQMALNIYRDYYTYCYYSLRRNAEYVHVLTKDDYGVIRYDSRLSSAALTSKDLGMEIGASIFVTPQCGCNNVCRKSDGGYLYGVIDIYGDKLYCVRFDAVPLRCAVGAGECGACYLCERISRHLLENKREDRKYSTVIDSLLSECVCRISNAQLLQCVDEDEFKKILED
jgi:hypothetical protein